MGHCQTGVGAQARTKRQYRRRSIARRVARSIGGHAQAYRCGACGFYHVGNPPRAGRD